MKKVILILLMSCVEVFAQKPSLGILKSVPTNSQQIFSISQHSYMCDSYGIIGLQKLLQREEINSSCKKSLEVFFKQNPSSQYYSQRLLKQEQQYHIEFKKQQCILFAQGEVTLSELLLRSGVALLEPSFKDEEYSTYFTRAQESAKREERGVYKSEVLRNCLGELYKN
ncbi:MAG: hypothetical protein JXQ67_05980 [Campylobacterales bacterium]|nr:hypothetical protein [Campylobacterales bacterium]